MIKTDTYQSNGDLIRELLANFTALDQSVTESMLEAEIRQQYKKLLNRISILCTYHGTNVPADFINSLEEWSELNYLQNINAFLEVGKRFTDLNEVERGIVQRRELQQEILHFSRIVDISSKQDEFDYEAAFANKRLRNSRDIPVFMKVLTEIMTVVRSRHLNRGKDLQVPENRYREIKYYKTNGRLSLTFDQEQTDFVLLLKSDRQKLRRDISYLYKNLLTYLTPLEAGLALCAYLSETTPAETVDILLIASVDHETVRILKWSYTPNAEEDLQAALRASLPIVNSLVLGGDVDFASEIDAFGAGEITFFHTPPKTLNFGIVESREGETVFTFELNNHSKISQDFRLKTLELIKELTQHQLNILSMESGHIHLDRDLDLDQEVGLEIGGYVYEVVKDSQKVAPKLTPMIDDDHVIIQLSPRKYESFFVRNIGAGVDYHLIPESSPIVRAIVVALYERIRKSDVSSALFLGGKNLYMEIDEFTTCEMFEDFNGRCDNGCAFFELGLLLFRSNPEFFVQYFNKRFQLNYDLHGKILDILSSDVSHDEKVRNIEILYATFAEVTNPHEPDDEFMKILDDFLSSSSDMFVHLNVLEDYYEVQQHKVRAMIHFLDLPIHLISLHFNARSGRLVLNQGHK